MIKLWDLFKKKEETLSLEEYYNQLMQKEDRNSFSFEAKYANQEEILYKICGQARPVTNRIKLIVITDTHNALNEEEFKTFMAHHPNYDACLLLGDFGYNDIPTILKYIPKDKIYALLGNHDTNYIELNGLNNLNGKMITINGVRILGIQGSFRYKPVSFPSFSQKESIEFLCNKEEADILVSHDSAFNSESSHNPAHQGLFGITYYLFKNRVPYHIHGHIHNPYRKTMINGTEEISSFLYEYLEL